MTKNKFYIIAGIWLALLVIALVLRERPPGVGAVESYSLISKDDEKLVTLAPHYDLTCSFADDLKRYTGRLVVTVPEKLTQTKELIFHIPPNYERSQASNTERNLRLQAVLLNQQTAQFDDQTTLLRIELPEATRGKSAKVEIAFESRLPELDLPATFVNAGIKQLLGMVVRKKHEDFYGLYSFSNGTASLANWYPILARREQGDIDLEIPGSQGDITNFEVGNYRLKVTAPRHVVVAASGVFVGKKDEAETSTHEFVGSGLRECTINASARYEVSKRKVDSTTIYSFYYPEDSSAGARALDAAEKALTIFNRDFGPYPYRELRIVEAPIGGSAGGMEYSGLVTIAQQFYSKFDLSSIPILQKLNLDSMKPQMEKLISGQLEWVVAHEVAHQWWHGIVGNNEKELPFVDESLTNFSTYHYMASRYGEKIGKQVAFQQLHMTYQLDRLNGGADGSLIKSAASFGTPMSYGGQIYSKGALHYIALKDLLGDDLFFSVLREYVKRNRFSIVGVDAFDETLADVLSRSGKGLLLQQAKDLRKRWLYESYGDTDIGTFSFTSFMEGFLGPEVFSGPDGMKRKLVLSLAEPLIKQFITELGK
jgi:hypothetical protein